MSLQLTLGSLAALEDGQEVGDLVRVGYALVRHAVALQYFSKGLGLHLLRPQLAEQSQVLFKVGHVARDGYHVEKSFGEKRVDGLDGLFK